MKNLASLAFTVFTLLAITSFSVLYSEGWRLNLPDKNNSNNQDGLLIKTGMLAVRSIPDGAKVYLDEKLITATNDTISSLNPNTYKLKVIKEGFETWEKNITVYPELVTDITAVLISQTPKLEPLTNYNVKAFDLSKNFNDIAFLTTPDKDSGVWLLPLANSPLNILRNSSRPIIKDDINYTPSIGTKIWWSYDDNELLIQLNEKGYLLYNVQNRNFLIPTGSNNANNVPQQISDPTTVFNRWTNEYKTKFENPRLQQIQKNQVIPQNILQNIPTSKTTWSPDEKKFVIEIPNQQNPQLIDLYIYNSEESLPVDEKRSYLTLQGIDLLNIKYSWYSDSYHLVLVEKSLPQTNPDSYTVSIVRIDGTNQTKIYTGQLTSDQAFSTPNGDKIIVMTSLKQDSPSNLYGISIR